MHSSIIVLSAFLSSVMSQALLGEICTSASQCPIGVSCYAARSGLQTLCGNLGADCTSSLDCAFNTCISGSCEGVLPSSSLATSTTGPSTTSASTTSTSTATGTVLALGAICTSTSQCSAGVQCYAVSSEAVAHCGNFGATCSTDAECAFNTCVSGSCSGTLSSSSVSLNKLSTITSSATTPKPTTSSTPGNGNGSGGNVTVTSTGAPAGFTTAVTVVNGVTSSVLVNSAGATTSFGAVATVTSVVTSSKGSGAGNLVVGMGMTGALAVAGGVALFL